MVSNLVILPSALSLIVQSLILLSWRSIFMQKCWHIAGIIGLWILSLVIINQVAQHDYITLQLGDWQAPFGITFIADGLSAVIFLAMATVLACCGIYALSDIENEQFSAGFLLAFWVLTLGLCGALFTGDLFNLYVWFEVILIGSFILLGLGKPTFWLYNKFKYVILNLIGTFLMLTAVGLMYGYAGTLNIASFSYTLLNDAHPNEGLILSVALIFFIAIAVKSAVFPVFNWLPAAYHSTSHTTSSLMGGLLTKIGLYVIIRFFYTIYPIHSIFLSGLTIALALLTMIVGVLGACSQFDYRRILAFDIISQVGYVLLALGLNTRNAIAAALFFLIHNILTKMILFMNSGLTYALTRQQDIRKMGGIYQNHPNLSWLFLIPALSLAGLPPLSGFWGKFFIIKATLMANQLILAGLALAISLITFYVMSRIWQLAYWQSPQTHLNLTHQPTQTHLFGLIFPIILGVTAILVLSLYPKPFYEFINMAAMQLTHPHQYIHAVLGDNP